MDKIKTPLLLLVFTAVLLLFGPPIYGFDPTDSIGHIPSVFVYTFCIWLLVIVSTYFIYRNLE